MTIVEVLTALLMLSLGSTALGWVWSTSIHELTRGQAEMKLTECLNEAAETIVSGHEVPSSLTIQEDTCNLELETNSVNSVKWVKITAEMEERKAHLWLRR